MPDRVFLRGQHECPGLALKLDGAQRAAWNSRVSFAASTGARKTSAGSSDGPGAHGSGPAFPVRGPIYFLLASSLLALLVLVIVRSCRLYFLLTLAR